MKNSTVVVMGVGAAFLAIALPVLFTVTSESRTFEENERIIAEANAAREARMTPEERSAREEARLAAVKAEAEAAQVRREEEARANFLPSARGACLTALKRTLHDPGSADFGIASEWRSAVREDGMAVVMPRIRAENGFGAVRLAEFRCVVERVGIDQIRVVSLDQLTS